MKILKLAMFTTAVLGLGFFAFSSQAQAAINGVLRVHPDNHRYFTDDSGKAIYLTGSHTWSNFQDFKAAGDPDFNWGEYLDFLVLNNHNFVRLWIIVEYDHESDMNASALPSMYQRTGPELAYDRRPKYDLTKFNQAFFDRLKDRIRTAQEKGIYVGIMLFDSVGAGYSCMTGALASESLAGWKSHPFRTGNNINNINGDQDGDGIGSELHTNSSGSDIKNIQKAYVSKVVETVNEFDNVLYEIGNELPYKSVPWQYDMINHIKNLEASANMKKHPIGMTAGGPDKDAPYKWRDISYAELSHGPAEWISPANYNQDNWEYLVSPLISDGSKVSILDSDHLYRQNFILTREWVWKAFLRGHNPIYMDIYQVEWPYRQDEPWNDPINGGYGKPLEVRPAMGHTKTYADKMDLKTMIPIDDSTCSSTKYCLQNPGQEYLVYQPNSGVFMVNIPVGDYAYEWFNPATGAVAGTGTVSASGGSKSFAPPFTGDAVLYLKNNNPADLNLDDKVDILDVQLCVNVILETEIDPVIVSRAKAVTAPLDICDVLDLQMIVNEILK